MTAFAIALAVTYPVLSLTASVTSAAPSASHRHCYTAPPPDFPQILRHSRRPRARLLAANGRLASRAARSLFVRRCFQHRFAFAVAFGAIGCLSIVSGEWARGVGAVSRPGAPLHAPLIGETGATSAPPRRQQWPPRLPTWRRTDTSSSGGMRRGCEARRAAARVHKGSGAVSRARHRRAG